MAAVLDNSSNRRFELSPTSDIFSLFVVLLAVVIHRVFQSRSNRPSQRFVKQLSALVKPPADFLPAIQRDELSGIDQSIHATEHVGFVFHSSLDPSLLKQALSETLAQFPAFSGRLDKSDRNRHAFVDFGAGVPFEVYTSSAMGCEEYETIKEWEAHDVFCKRSWRSFVVRQRQPVLSVKLTHFPRSNGMSFLGLSYQHRACDGQGLAHFLQVWSYHCKGKYPLFPPPKPQGFGQRRVVRLDEVAASGMPFPLQFPTYKWTKPANWLAGVAIAAYGNMNTQVFECQLDKARLKSFKKLMCATVSNVEWVSTYEATFAAILAAKAVALGSQESGQNIESLKKALRVTAVVNGRGKIPGYSHLFFGNCFTHVEVQPRLDETFMNQEPLSVAASFAEQLHDQLMRSKGHPRELARLHLWANAAQERGEAACIEMDCLRDWSLERNLMVNDWILSKLDCGLDLDMGTGKRPALFAWPTQSVPKNLFNLIPRNNDSNTLAVRLPRSLAPRFFEALDSMQFPFKLLC